MARIEPIEIDLEHLPEPKNIIAFDNGLLDISTGVLYRHTPRWFSRFCLEYEYDPDAKCDSWLNWLTQVSQGEEDWLNCLQMWFGYLLVADTSQQKLMLLHGPPRSGKGTVCRRIQHVMGKHNCVSVTMGDLAVPFGLERLIGKLVAIDGDVHIGRRDDSSAILGMLKRITGEDSVSIRLPHAVHALTHKLNVRFTLAVNRLMDFPDPSGALASRTIVLPFRESFVGREDITLDKRLETEASGILNWALEGLAMLRKVGRLTQPESGKEILEDFARLSSPVRSFVSDWCEYPASGKTVPCMMLRKAWELWCEVNGHEVGTVNRFGENLKSACPDVKRVLRGPKVSRETQYENIHLTDETISLLQQKGYDITTLYT